MQLLAAKNAGHSLSHDVCPDELQLMHQKVSLLVLRHSAIWWSFPHVPHAACWLHLAARCLMVSDWQLRHLLGSFPICLAQTLLPDITRPSLIALFAASCVLNLAIKCAAFWPVAHLCSGLIHLVDISPPSSSPDSHSILLSSASASRLCATGRNSTSTEMALSLMMAELPKLAMKATFSFLTQLAVSGSLSSYMTPPLFSFFAPTALGSAGP